MRAQLSLQFTDEDLFQNFIKPYKDERLLNSLIIKCLTAYYYDEDVRNKIEGVSMDSATGGEQVSSTQEICDSIRQALMMQDFMAQELQNTIDSGTEDISDILNQTNEMAMNTGVAKETSSSSGSSILKIGLNVSDKSTQETSSKESSNKATSNSELGLIIKAIKLLASASGNAEVSHLFDDVGDSPIEVESKNESEPVVDKAMMSEPDIEPVFEPEIPEPVVEVQDEVVLVKEEIPVSQPEPVSEPIPEPETEDRGSDEDAKDAIGDLLGSLF